MNSPSKHRFAGPRSAPLVTVGLPVYNGAEFIGEAIASLLAQTCEDMELVIADNASTDATEEICRAFAARDSRVRYHRHAANLGATRNFNAVVEMARGTYFKWAAHDDVHRPDYIRRCVEVLDADAAVVLAVPGVQDIDAHGNELPKKPCTLRWDDEDVAVRFRDLIRLDYSCEAIFGLMRAADIRRTPLLSNYADCDRVLLAELGLAGRIRQIPEVLFVHRQHDGRSVVIYKSRQERSQFFDPAKGVHPAFPYTREYAGFAAAIRRVPLSSANRMRCQLSLARWALANAGKLCGDYTYAARGVLRPLKRRLVGAPKSSGGETR